MIIFFGFLAPVLAYLLLLRRLIRRGHQAAHKIALIAALGVAVWTLLAVTLTVAFATRWRGAVNIAWSGIEASQSSPLAIGGAQEQAVVGWSERYFYPRLEAQAADASTARLTITGGEGFLYDRTAKTFLNGVELASGADKTIGDFRLHLVDGWFDWFSRTVEVRDASDKILSKFTLPARSGSDERARVVPLGRIVSLNAGALRADTPKLMRLEDVAGDINLLVTASGKILVLDDSMRQAACALPCHLSVKWTTRSVPFTIERSAASARALNLTFDQPLRLTSPLPPTNDKGEAELTITGSPAPGDLAFALPFGGAADEWRGKLKVVARDGAYGFQSGTTLSGSASVAGDNGVAYRFEIARNLPQVGNIIWLLSAALATFVGGLILCRRQMQNIGAARLSLYGLAASVWALAAFRVLLALRFATDAYALDDVTVKGVTLGFLSLALIPSLMFLAARWRYDFKNIPAHNVQLRKRGFVTGAIYLCVVIIFALIIYNYTASLWSELPARFAMEMGRLGLVLVIAVICYLFLLHFFIYKVIDEELPRARRYVLLPLWGYEWVLDYSTRFWQSLAGRNLGWKSIGRLFLYAIIYFGVFALCLSLPGYFLGRKILQENVIPLVFFWLMALFWLGQKRVATPAWMRAPSIRALFVVTPLTILAPIFFVPIVTGDVGSIYSALAIFASLAGALFLSNVERAGWRRVGVAAALAVTATVLLGYLIYTHVENLPLPGNARVRLLSLKPGDDIERTLANAARDGTDDGGTSSAQQLRDAYEHARSNKAIAHEGGWLGLGFGNAPTRRSPVRQDTLQFDSTYSFFVTSENGIIGGVSLLLLYAMPMFLVWQSRPSQRFAVGHHLALIVCSVLLLEALTHAAMNVGFLPITGRSLPLTNVNSPSDLLRWLVLMALAAQALAWREGDSLEQESGVATTMPPTVAATATARSSSTGDADAKPSLVGAFARRVSAKIPYAPIALVPLLLLFAVVIYSVRITGDAQLSQPLDYRAYNDEIRRHIEAGDIALQPDLTIKANDNIAPDSFLRDEVNRFNALPHEIKLEQRDPAAYEQELRGARTRADYYERLNRLRVRASLANAPPPVNLFRLVPQRAVRPLADDDTNDVETATDKLETDNPATDLSGTTGRTAPVYRLALNPVRPAQVTFGLNTARADAPVVKFADDEKSPLVGAAWVNGRWVAAFDRNAPLAWTDHLAEAFEIARLPGTGKNGNEHRLTLKRAWQTAAMELAAAKGRALHEQLLNQNSAPARQTARLPQALPPRVAITVLDAASGATIALGTYPRSAPGRFWRQDGRSREWLPPADWLASRAPASFRTAYASEGNFARMIVGSTTKPLFAAAILATHPGLDRQLQVQGSDASERELFGVQLAKAWQVTPLGKWRDFREYLAWSDNRYHVRLGFLGLSETNGAEIAAGGASASIKESLTVNAQPRVWGKRPRFVSGIEANGERFTRFGELHRTPLAAALGSMFSIDIERNQHARRYSFWSRLESDEASGVAQTAWQPFAALMPERTNLALDEVTDPRDYVSILFGGYTNLWSNVDLAAAFLTAVTGHPRSAYIVSADKPFVALETRRPFPDIAARLRPGLAQCVTQGTATEKLKATEALTLITSLRGVSAYAKTGTLRPQENQPSTSRILIALIKWKDERQGIVEKGIVISIVGERAGSKTATEWLGEFLVANRQLVTAAFN